jgi:hypothetical protein
VVFQKKLPLISEILSDPLRGALRPRKLTTEEEERVLNYVIERQRSMRCMTFSEVIRYINEEMLAKTNRRVSPRFVQHNLKIMSNLEVGGPQEVETQRIECTYETFVDFFNRWNAALQEQEYDPDLIINVDETTSNAGKKRRTTKVLFDPNIGIRPVTACESKEEHATMSCGISASGNHTIPTFIMKTKTVSVEDELKFDYFDNGSYALQYSYNWWQDCVRTSFFMNIYQF